MRKQGIERRGNRIEKTPEEMQAWFNAVEECAKAGTKRMKKIGDQSMIEVGSKVIYLGEQGEVIFISDLNIPDKYHIVYSENQITARVAIDEIELL